jgi:transposase
MLRISLDAKATVKIGPFARGGKSRVRTSAADHDFEAAGTVTPVGLFLPAFDELFLYGVTSKVTSDCLVDRVIDWWESVKGRFPDITTLLINLDNGPECHSRRTQFMQRLLEFAQRYHLTIRLAYYPPYHSKYNPIERCWGILERDFHGALLDSLETVIQYATSMTWKGKHPVVSLATAQYRSIKENDSTNVRKKGQERKKVEPHELVKKSGELEKANVHWHAVSSGITDGHLTRLIKHASVFPADMALLLLDTDDADILINRLPQINRLLGQARHYRHTATYTEGRKRS